MFARNWNSHTANEHCKMIQLLWTAAWCSLTKLKIELMHDPNGFLGTIYPQGRKQVLKQILAQHNSKQYYSQ